MTLSKAPFQRKFPRRTLSKRVGVMFGGNYFVAESGELGEGGMSIVTEFVLTENREVVVNFQIPDGTFASLRGHIRSVVPGTGDAKHLVTHGISFDEVPLVFKRQIRAFVSARSLNTAKI